MTDNKNCACVSVNKKNKNQGDPWLLNDEEANKKKNQEKDQISRQLVDH